MTVGGYLNNPHDGQRYLFSFIANQPSILQTATRETIDKSVVLFAGAFREVQPQVTWTASTVAFTSPANPGHSYWVQFKQTLSDPDWRTRGSDITATNARAFGNDASFASLPQRFYRALAVP